MARSPGAQTGPPHSTDKTFGVNVRGTLLTVQKALPLCKDGGSVILTGSIASIKGIPAFGVYSATKAAIAFARSICKSRRSVLIGTAGKARCWDGQAQIVDD